MSRKMIDQIVFAIGGEGRRIAPYFRSHGIQGSKIFYKIDGKPLIQYLIDTALSVGFKRIFLLVSYHEDQVRHFIKNSYLDQNMISTVYGGVKGKQMGVPYLLSSVRELHGNSFIYSDGNVLYSSQILKKLRSKPTDSAKLISVVVSTNDRASTHAQFYLDDHGEIDVDVRVRDRKPGCSHKQSLYYSLGLMVLSEKIFSEVKDFSQKRDLDFVTEEIMKKNPDALGVIKYRGDWVALHDKEDIDIIDKFKYSNTFRTLTSTILERRNGHDHHGRKLPIKNRK